MENQDIAETDITAGDQEAEAEAVQPETDNEPVTDEVAPEPDEQAGTADEGAEMDTPAGDSEPVSETVSPDIRGQDDDDPVTEAITPEDDGDANTAEESAEMDTPADDIEPETEAADDIEPVTEAISPENEDPADSVNDVADDDITAGDTEAVSEPVPAETDQQEAETVEEGGEDEGFDADDIYDASADTGNTDDTPAEANAEDAADISPGSPQADDVTAETEAAVDGGADDDVDLAQEPVEDDGDAAEELDADQEQAILEEDDIETADIREEIEDTSQSVDELENQAEDAADVMESEDVSNDAVEQSEESAEVQEQEDDSNMGVDESGDNAQLDDVIAEDSETGQKDDLVAEEDNSSNTVCNTDNSEVPDNAVADENDDDFSNDIVETSELNEEDGNEGDAIDTVDDKKLGESDDIADDIVETNDDEDDIVETNDTADDIVETNDAADDIVETSDQPQEDIADSDAESPEVDGAASEDVINQDENSQEEAAAASDIAQPTEKDTSAAQDDELEAGVDDGDIVQATDEGNQDADDKNEDDILDLDDDLDIRGPEEDSGVTEKQQETEDKSDKSATPTEDVDAGADQGDADDGDADIDEMDIQEVSQEPTWDGADAEGETQDSDVMDIQLAGDAKTVDDEDETSQAMVDNSETLGDAKEDMDISQNEADEPVAMDTEDATDASKKDQEAGTPEKADGDGDKSEDVADSYPEADDNTLDIKEAEKDKPGAGGDAAAGAMKAEPGGDEEKEAESEGKQAPPTGDTQGLKIKQEAIENGEEAGKPEAASSEADGTSGLKIVGVTSAVGVDGDSETKGDDSGSLELKISSVTGAGDASEKKEVTEDKVQVKKEGGTEAKPAKVEEAKKEAKEEKKKEGKQEDDDVIAVKEEKKPTPKPKSSKIQKCIVCSKVGKCKYNIVRNGDVKHLCDDTCFKRFRGNPTTYLKHAETSKPVGQERKAAAPQANSVPAGAATKAQTTPPANKANQNQAQQPYKTCNVCQLMNVRTSKPFLNWQGLDFCGEECLGKFQGGLSLTCAYCSSHIHQTNKAKFCWRVGQEVKHFCSATCNTEFVKRMKLCAFCNKDLATVGDSFMAPVDDKGTFKDFCSQKCLQSFEERNNKGLDGSGMMNGKASVPPKGNFLCAVCGKTGPVKHEMKHEGKVNRLCSDPCFSAFQYANKLSVNPCNNCGASCQADSATSQFIQYEGQQKRFCSFMCVNTFRNKCRKTVPCAWCGTKKTNFDMIERVDANNKYQLFCSLNCLSLYRVNLQATSNQAVVCDQCRKFVPAQYHLTMSDASVRNFCSYGCVMQFQAQFQAPKPPAGAQPGGKQAYAAAGQPAPQTTTRSGRVVKGSAVVQQQRENAAAKAAARNNRNNSSDSFPIISNVVSLAPKGTQQQINIKSSTGVTVTDQQGIKTTTTTTGNQTVQQQIIIQPPPPKTVKNKSMLCKPIVQTKATSCRPHTQTKETQTDGKIEPDKYLVPVPVPVYTPTPLPMYSLPTPVLIPVPVPVPIPVFIPTTKKSTASILKQIKEIREKIPADPLEAELLMMAEAVAGKDESSSSESDDGGETEQVTPVKEAANPPQSGDLGEDMLQMALRMASEMSDEPVMDLENSLEPVAVSTVPPPVPAPVPRSPVVDDDEDDYIPPGSRGRRSRGSAAASNKRSSRSNPRRSSKRQKIDIQPEYNEPTPSPPQPAAPPQDANFHLKYTYGVNAFKHWVMQKNSVIEQNSKPNYGRAPKTFKLDILQCTSEELNHSLCLFVKEVRKPNGEMYAVDSIYYLTLGIQQYLFENGRIDNIFTDFYFERFTECLNELLTRYEPKLNHSGQLVCRIEEEHLWESKQLGAHSPYVLLNSLVYFNTKFFMLKTSEDHLKLSFTHIMKHWKKNPSGRGSGTGPNQGRSVYLRYYCPTPQGKGADMNKKKKEEMPVYEQTENLDNPLRCPVKLYEFYLSKCPESIKNRNDTFYLVPERSCVPDSPVWYSTAMLGVDQMAKMLNRVRLVREIQEAHLHTQPVYI